MTAFHSAQNITDLNKSLLQSKYVRPILRYAIPCLLVWGLYFLSFYPGMMSRDSLDQWIEVVAFRFDDWHPAFSSWLYWLLTRLWVSPAVICLTQLLALSVVFAFGMVKLEKRGLPRWALYLITLFFSLFPLNGFLTNTLFKDVPFSIAVLLLFLLTTEIFESNGRWLAKPGNILGLAITLAFITLIRHNGVVTALSTLGGLGVFYVAYGRKLLLLTFCYLALVFLVKGPLYRRLNVQGHSYGLEILLSHQIAAVLHSGQQPTAAEAHVLNEVLPLALWKEKYQPYTSDPLVFDPQYNYNYLARPASRAALIGTWFRLVRSNLPALLEHQVSVSELVWRLDQSKFSYTYAAHPLIDPNPQGLATASVLPLLRNFLVRAYNYSHHRSWFRIVLYRPALYLYAIGLLALLSYWQVRQISYLLTVLPVASVATGLLFTIPCQHVRYLYPVFLLAPFFAGYCLLYWNRHKQARQLADYSGYKTDSAEMLEGHR